MILKRKRIIITGGTSGIGLQVVKALAADNDLIVIARDQQKLDRLSADYPSVVGYCCDLAKNEQVVACVADLRARYDAIDVLINNAAVQYPKKMTDADYDPATINVEITTNFTAVCLLTYGLLPLLLQADTASVVNVNSGLALAPKSTSAVYCATKAAMHSFSQSLYHQLKDTHISVTQAFMPVVDTPMTAGRHHKKISAQKAATAMLEGIQRQVIEHDIGKVKLLRWLLRIAPSVAKRIMVNA